MKGDRILLEQFFEEKERKEFNKEHWIEKCNDEFGRKTKWAVEAEKGRRCMANDVPINETLSAHEQYKDKYFIDNWVQKSVTWKTGALIGSDLFVDLKSFDGKETDDLRLAEAELNFISSSFTYLNRLREVIKDWFTTGIGCVRTGWDAEDLDTFWQTGKPTMNRVIPEDVAFRFTGQDLNELEAVYHKTYVSKYVLFDLYPDKKQEIEGAVGQFSTEKEKVEVLTIQYRKKHRIQKVEVIDNLASMEVGDKVSWIYTLAEVEEMQKNEAEVPEGIVFGKPFWVKEVAWYQAIILPQGEIVLEYPKYIGKRSTYHFLMGYWSEKHQYPLGMVYFCVDILDISIILMTLLTIQVAKTNRPTPFVEEGALDDLEDFLENFWKLSYVGTVNEEWRRKNPSAKPITWEIPPINADLPLTLHRIIGEAIKNQTGAVDSARGEMQYSGQSGVLAYQLQQASQTFVRDDIMAWTTFLKDIFEALKDNLSVYRNYPHVIEAVDSDGLVRPLEVATHEHNMLVTEKYYIEPIVEINPEAERQRKRQDAMQTYGLGAISTRDLLEEMYPDAEMKYNRWLNERGLLDIAQAMQTYPELREIISQIIEQLNQRAQQQGNVEQTTQGG